jgi:hypothetical protein
MRTLLITGASRGIASCRHPEEAEALQQLAQSRKNFDYCQTRCD